MTIFGRVVPDGPLLLAGIVVVVAAVLAALYRWTPFGLSTRAASENEVSAMLAGLSPSRLAVVNTVLACVVAGGLGVLVAPLIALDAQTLAFQVVPALAAALLAGFTSFFIACFAGLAIGCIQCAARLLGDAELVPDRRRAVRRSAALSELFVFLVIVARAVPPRGEPARPRRDRREAPAGRAPAGAAAAAEQRSPRSSASSALIVFPYDFRQALINSLLGIIICLSLVVIIGFVGQISVVQLALAGVAGFTMSHLTTDAGGHLGEVPDLAPDRRLRWRRSSAC